jgi:hypothetical protein
VGWRFGIAQTKTTSIAAVRRMRRTDRTVEVMAWAGG